jgi:hypothetical protein
MHLRNLFVMLALVAGCKDNAKDAAGGDSAKGTDASGKCPSGFTLQPKGNFCIKLPAGTKGDGGAGMAQGDGKTMRYSWAGGEKGSDFGLSVDVRPMSEHYPDNMERVKSPPYQGKALKDGKIGDTGAWGSGESGPPPDGFAQRHYINSVNKSDTMQLSCNVTRASGTGAPSEDEVFEACKTIVFAK